MCRPWVLLRPSKPKRGTEEREKGNTIVIDLIIITISPNPLLTMGHVVSITSVSLSCTRADLAEAQEKMLEQRGECRCLGRRELPGSTGQDVQITAWQHKLSGVRWRKNE